MADMTPLSPWLTTKQVAQHCGIDQTQVYNRLLQRLVVRRIGVRGGVAPWGRLVRVERSSVLRMLGEPDAPAEDLPRWVTLKQAADYYQVSVHLIRRLIAYEQLEARRIGSSKSIRIDRNSLLRLGQYRFGSLP